MVVSSCDDHGMPLFLKALKNLMHLNRSVRLLSLLGGRTKDLRGFG